MYIHIHLSLSIYIYIHIYIYTYIYIYIYIYSQAVADRIVACSRVALALARQVLDTMLVRIGIRIPFGDHPLRLERYREDYHLGTYWYQY